jgi:hypothetical protein
MRLHTTLLRKRGDQTAGPGIQTPTIFGAFYDHCMSKLLCYSRGRQKHSSLNGDTGTPPAHSDGLASYTLYIPSPLQLSSTVLLSGPAACGDRRGLADISSTVRSMWMLVDRHFLKHLMERSNLKRIGRPEIVVSIITKG